MKVLVVALLLLPAFGLAAASGKTRRLVSIDRDTPMLLACGIIACFGLVRLEDCGLRTAQTSSSRRLLPSLPRPP